MIVFDLAAFNSDSRHQRRSPSFVPHSVDQPNRSNSREHAGLMGWPEHFYKARQHMQNSEGFRQHANSLSARAMQLSIYGSTVCSLLDVLSRSEVLIIVQFLYTSARTVCL